MHELDIVLTYALWKPKRGYATCCYTVWVLAMQLALINLMRCIANKSGKLIRKTEWDDIDD